VGEATKIRSDIKMGSRERAELALALATVLAIAGGVGARAATTIITIDVDGVTPQRATIRMGGAVQWENQDVTPHRIVSTPEGFFHTGRIEPSATSDPEVFISSGTFPYGAPIDPDIRGSVRVPVKVRPADKATPTPGATITLRVALERRSHRVYDVQRRRKDGRWITIIAHTKDVRIEFVPQQTGTYWFRARVTKTRANITSKWSPPKEKFVAPPP
jgi:plastocyanin